MNTPLPIEAVRYIRHYWKHIYITPLKGEPCISEDLDSLCDTIEALYEMLDKQKQETV